MVLSQTLPSITVVDYAPGELIAEKYRLLRFLGEGSQGSVWLAVNLALHAEVAIKIVRGGPANAIPTRRLQKEARAAAKIPHPASVRVFDLGWTANGDTFIVMEFLQGESLGAHLTTCGRMSPVEAARTLLPIADVLFVAHRRGIVHRDLKPENVFLAKSGATIQPKLLDFGIVKLGRDVGHMESVITDVGALVGSPAYSSPEQIACRADVGQAADVWSFCVVLYECLTGTLPFESETCQDLFRRIESEPPVPILAHGVGDLELWEILRRGLSKDPAQRWPDMKCLGRALASWLRALGVEDDISGIRLDARWLTRPRGEAVAPDLDPRSPSDRQVGENQESAIGVRQTARGRRRTPAHWLAVGFVAAAVPVVLGYTVATTREEPRKPDALAVSAPPPRAVAPAEVTPVEVAPTATATARATATAPPEPIASAKPAPSSTAATKPSPRPRPQKPLDLMEPY
jgi:serine/threonine-protein kinase